MSFFSKIFNKRRNNEINDIFTLSIGEKFPIKRTSKGDGIKLESTPMGMFLCLFYSKPSVQEIAKIQSGDITLFFAYLNPVLECVIQLDDDFAGDAPYYAPLYRETLTEKELNPRCIYVCLVDSESYLLKALRIIEIKAKAANFLSKVLHLQIKSSLTSSEYNELVDCIMQNFTLKDLAVTSECAVLILRDNSITELAKDVNI